MKTEKILPLISTILYSIILFFFVNSQAISESPSEMDVKELIRRVETQYLGETSYAVVKMKIITESWSREISMESWSEGRDKFIARILSPKKDQGFATLKVGDDIWNYMPKIDRLMKIPSSLMGDNWMGSHLTNDDLVKQNKIDELYELKLEKIEGNSATVLCTPKPDAAVVWGSITYTVDLEKTIPLVISYFDEDGELVRTIEFDNVKKISGRWVPMKMSVKPVETPDEITELLYDDLKFDIKLKEDLFSVSSLRRH